MTDEQEDRTFGTTAPAEDVIDESRPGFSWMAPEEFHSLGLEYSDEEREDHIAELADAIWPGGSDEQQNLLHGWYGEVAAAAAADGAAYTGICILGMEDDRVSTASLTVRCEPVDGTDAGVVAAALHEALSNDPKQEVHRVEAKSGPAVLVLTEIHATPHAEAPESSRPEPLVFVQVDVYCPLPAVEQLLIFSLTTPSLADVPWYVSRLSEIADTVEIEGSESTGAKGDGSESAPGSVSPLYNLV